MRRAPKAAYRSGFTVVEVLLALMLLVVGMLALASTAAWTTRSVADASRVTRAVSAASSELELLLGRACRGDGTGVTIESGEFATIGSTSSAGRLADLAVVLKTRSPDGIRVDTFVTARTCLR